LESVSLVVSKSYEEIEWRSMYILHHSELVVITITTRNIHFYGENLNDDSETVIEDRFYDEFFHFIIDQW